MKQLPVNSTMFQIGNCPFAAPVFLWQPELFFGFLLLPGCKNRRLKRRLPKNHGHRLGKRNLPNLNQIVQRALAADAAREPVPLSVGDFEAVMLSGAVSIPAELHQLLRLIVLKPGEQIHLFGLCHLLLRMYATISTCLSEEIADRFLN